MNSAPAIAASDADADPVSSFSQPKIVGPTNPPIVPTELMNASPPAAAIPVRKRGGIVQKMPRAALMPLSASVMKPSDTQKCDDQIAPRNPTADSRQANVRFRTFP